MRSAPPAGLSSPVVCPGSSVDGQDRRLAGVQVCRCFRCFRDPPRARNIWCILYCSAAAVAAPLLVCFVLVLVLSLL